MKALLPLLIATILAATGYGQTIKTLGFNSTNGVIVSATNYLRFTNDVNVAGGPLLNGAGIFYVTPTNGGLNFEEEILTDASNNTVLSWTDPTILTVGRPLSFATNNAATTRTNLGLGGGITTNRAFVSYNGTNYITNSVSISNGVITGWTQ